MDPKKSRMDSVRIVAEMADTIHISFFHVFDVLRIWFASHRKPVTGIPGINLGELEIGKKLPT